MRQYLFSEKIDKNRPPGHDRRAESSGNRAAGEPEGARPASDEIWQYLYSEKINKNRPPGNDGRAESSGNRAAGEPEGARPVSDEIWQYLYSFSKKMNINTASG